VSFPEAAFRFEANQARNSALRLLAVRPRTVEEMKHRLGQRYGAIVVEQTVARLQSEGLLNDAEFAQQWRSSRERRKPRSRGIIERELRDKGVEDSVISETLEGYDSTDAAYRAAARYATRQSHCERTTFDRRVGTFLNRRGFEPGVIRQTLQRLREELAESDAGTEEHEGLV